MDEFSIRQETYLGRKIGQTATPWAYALGYLQAVHDHGRVPSRDALVGSCCHGGVRVRCRRAGGQRGRRELLGRLKRSGHGHGWTL